MSFLADILSSIAERGKSLVDFDQVPGSARSVEHLDGLCDRLLSGAGEASGLAIASEILHIYASLDDEAKTGFFKSLAGNYGPDFGAMETAAQAFLDTPGAVSANLLHRASEPRRQEVFRRLNQAPGGTGRLISMRTDLLARLRADPDLALVDDDLRHLLSSWFNRGFLELRRINWQTPAATLEKIIEYEAVHEITDWDDLRRRIDPPDRRLYAFFHPRLADEPLIFVEVALTGKIPDSIDSILNPDREIVDPKDAKVAVFYSISNCQTGLRGISFGNFLIKQVVEDLSAELRTLKQYVTLSPIPGFARWLGEQAEELGGEAAEVLGYLAMEDWWKDADLAKRIKKWLEPAVGYYLVEARSKRGRVIDPVARFHLGNGARLERINWLADTGPAGLTAAYGLMVNYLYKLDEIEKNHEKFASGQTVSASQAVTKLSRAATGLEPKPEAEKTKGENA